MLWRTSPKTGRARRLDALPLELEFDEQADAAYLRVRCGHVAYSWEMDASHVVDFDANDEIVGIEFLAVSSCK